MWRTEESLSEGYKVGGDLNKFVLFDVDVILSRPLCCRPMGEAEPSPGDSQWDGKALLFWSESECWLCLLMIASTCKNWQLQLPSALWLHPEIASLQGPYTRLTNLSSCSIHSKHTEILGCGLVGAILSEKAQSTWFQLFWGQCFCSFITSTPWSSQVICT